MSSLLSSSCFYHCSIAGIEVSENILISAEEKGINYCELLEQSLQKNKRAVIQLSLLNFDGAIGYDHGTLLVELIRKIGENEYLSLIRNLNDTEKKTIESYLQAGLEYHYDSSLKEKSIKSVFPELNAFLQNRN
ncbi:hypothetical protein [Flavobacterium cerinum]|uniref:DUF4375 domain-containing protein n=1 Tax=Flavobacterium cerinum TaxID=2502784 RepID=A0ABY5IRB7_9FLAO|nr:hypothetical protein [Flavobacterium cerinum]UUC44825.1 hypothetical protein NOX80_14460 [Flavobacterium cerinum]